MAKNTELPYAAAAVFLFSACHKLLGLLILYFATGRSLGLLLSFGDTPSYLRIAQSFPLPYSDPAMLASTIHYPLYPMTIYLVNLLANNWIASGYLSIIGISSLASVVFYCIARKFSSHAFSLALLSSCLPPKWVQVSLYPLSEPVLMLFLLLAVLTHLDRRYCWSYFCLSILLLSRPLGAIFLMSFLAYDVFHERRYKHFIYAAIATLPFIFFHGYLYVLFGKILLFQHADKGGTWGGSIFSWPLAGLLSGLVDAQLTVARKLYTTIEFLLYCCVVVAAVKSLKDGMASLFSFIIIPYFAFTLFLKGDNHNWWMLSLPRFLLPLAPFGFLYYFCAPRHKYFYPALITASILLGYAYIVGSHYMHIQYGPYA